MSDIRIRLVNRQVEEVSAFAIPMVPNRPMPEAVVWKGRTFLRYRETLYSTPTYREAWVLVIEDTKMLTYDEYGEPRLEPRLEPFP